MNDAMDFPSEIRGVLIPVRGARLLLPNAAVSEVITLSSPEPVTGAPEWLLGRVSWRGWHVPLVAFSELAGLPGEQGALDSRVTVLKIFGGNPRMPYVAVATQGFPRLTTVSADILVITDEEEVVADGVWRRVLVRDEQAIIPDLAFIEKRVEQALADADAMAV